MAEVRALAAEAGRSPEAIELTVFAGVALSDTWRDRPWERGLIRGPAEPVVATLADYADAGVTEMILSIGGSTRRRLATLEALVDAGLALDGPTPTRPEP